jgi:hypothetical protein
MRNTMSKARRPMRKNERLAERVREVLVALGGEAHRALVIEQVAVRLGHDARHIPDDLQSALIRSFEAALRDEERRQVLGFHLPFGEGSHRWAARVA